MQIIRCLIMINGVSLRDDAVVITWHQPTMLHYMCVSVSFTVLKWLMASAGRTFTTPVQQQLQLLPLLFKVTHTHTNARTRTHTGPRTALLPTQSYLAIKLNFSLHLLKMVRSSVSSYLSPSLSLHLSPCRLPRWRLMRAMMRWSRMRARVSLSCPRACCIPSTSLSFWQH